MLVSRGVPNSGQSVGIRQSQPRQLMRNTHLSHANSQDMYFSNNLIRPAPLSCTTKQNAVVTSALHHHQSYMDQLNNQYQLQPLYEPNRLPSHVTPLKVDQSSQSSSQNALRHSFSEPKSLFETSTGRSNQVNVLPSGSVFDRREHPSQTQRRLCRNISNSSFYRLQQSQSQSLLSDTQNSQTVFNDTSSECSVSRSEDVYTSAAADSYLAAPSGDSNGSADDSSAMNTKVLSELRVIAKTLTEKFATLSSQQQLKLQSFENNFGDFRSEFMSFKTSFLEQLISNSDAAVLQIQNSQTESTKAVEVSIKQIQEENRKFIEAAVERVHDEQSHRIQVLVAEFCQHVSRIGSQIYADTKDSVENVFRQFMCELLIPNVKECLASSLELVCSKFDEKSDKIQDVLKEVIERQTSKLETQLSLKLKQRLEGFERTVESMQSNHCRNLEQMIMHLKDEVTRAAQNSVSSDEDKLRHLEMLSSLNNRQSMMLVKVENQLANQRAMLTNCKNLEAQVLRICNALIESDSEASSVCGKKLCKTQRVCDEEAVQVNTRSLLNQASQIPPRIIHQSNGIQTQQNNNGRIVQSNTVEETQSPDVVWDDDPFYVAPLPPVSSSNYYSPCEQPTLASAPVCCQPSKQANKYNNVSLSGLFSPCSSEDEEYNDDNEHRILGRRPTVQGTCFNEPTFEKTVCLETSSNMSSPVGFSRATLRTVAQQHQQLIYTGSGLEDELLNSSSECGDNHNTKRGEVTNVMKTASRYPLNTLNRKRTSNEVSIGVDPEDDGDGIDQYDFSLGSQDHIQRPADIFGAIQPRSLPSVSRFDFARQNVAVKKETSMQTRAIAAKLAAEKLLIFNENNAVSVVASHSCSSSVAAAASANEKRPQKPMRKRHLLFSVEKNNSKIEFDDCLLSNDTKKRRGRPRKQATAAKQGGRKPKSQRFVL